MFAIEFNSKQSNKKVHKKSINFCTIHQLGLNDLHSSYTDAYKLFFFLDFFLLSLVFVFSFFVQFQFYCVCLAEVLYLWLLSFFFFCSPSCCFSSIKAYFVYFFFLFTVIYFLHNFFPFAISNNATEKSNETRKCETSNKEITKFMNLNEQNE